MCGEWLTKLVQIRMEFIAGTCENRIHELIVVDDGYTREELYHLSSDISCGFPSSERDISGL